MGNITQGQFGKILADAAAKVFVSNGRMFPDFDTLGLEMAAIVKERTDHIQRNPEAYANYFELEENHAKRFGGVNMHVRKTVIVKTNE